jgi:para-nitrobenzyl esterase
VKRPNSYDVATRLVRQQLAGKQQRVSVILGATDLDAGFGTAANTKDELWAVFGANADAARKAYDPNGNEDLRNLLTGVNRDRTKIEPNRFAARALSRAGQPVWEFRFSYVAESMRSEWPGAPHATEIPFVFDTVRAKYGDKLMAADEKLAPKIHAYWVQFAKTGDPNEAGLPKWPRYNVDKDQLMNFTADGPVPQPDPSKARLDVIAPLQK